MREVFLRNGFRSGAIYHIRVIKCGYNYIKSVEKRPKRCVLFLYDTHDNFILDG